MSQITRASDYQGALATIKQRIQSSQKAGGVKPEYIGKLIVYLSPVDAQLRAAADQRRQGQTGCEVRVA